MIRQAIAKVMEYGNAAQAIIDSAEGVVENVRSNGVALDKLKPPQKQ
jgi:hypothetical protein